MPGSVGAFVHRGSSQYSRREIAAQSRVRLPPTVLGHGQESRTAWETDSSVADTTTTSADMRDRYDGRVYQGDDRDQYEESDEDDEDGIVQEMLSTSGPDSERPEELQHMVDAAPRRSHHQSRWNASRTQNQHSPALFIPAQGLTAAAQANLNKYLPTPIPRDVQHSDGDDDEPASQMTRKVQKPMRKNGSQTRPRSPSTDRPLSIQSKGGTSSGRHERLEVVNPLADVKAEHPRAPKGPATLPPSSSSSSGTPYKLKPTMREPPALTPSVKKREPSQPPDGHSIALEVIEDDEQSVDLKAFHSQPKLHDFPPQLTETFDITDASAVMEDLETNGPNLAASAKFQQIPHDQKHQPTRKRILDLDYAPETLSKMEFSDLLAQPFDVDPNASTTNPSHGDPAESGNLTQKLALLHDQTDETRSIFFANLSAEQWEDCGDWFVTQFGDLVKNMKDARRERNRAMNDFEEEIERRHKAVEANGQQLQKGLQEMRAGGMGVLRVRKAGG